MPARSSCSAPVCRCLTPCDEYCRGRWGGEEEDRENPEGPALEDLDADDMYTSPDDLREAA